MDSGIQNETLGPFRIGGKTLISAARCPCQDRVEGKKNDTEKEGTHMLRVVRLGQCC